MTAMTLDAASRFRCLAILSLVVLVSFGARAAEKTAEQPDDGATVWTQLTRDVYIDGQLDRGAVVLRSKEPDRTAVLLDREATTALVFAGEPLTLTEIDVEKVTLGESGWETRSTTESRELDGQVWQVDEATVLIGHADRHVLVAPHQGRPGETEADTLFAMVPSWKALYDAYAPDEAAVSTLADHAEQVQLILAFGTWCGDSKREVPRLLKALDQAGNDRLDLQLMTLGAGFERPSSFIRDRRLTNVPTLIVLRDGLEIGRVVETPATETMVTDLAEILRERPLHHTGRWQRESRIAAGRYRYLDPSGAERGSEDWELYGLENGGSLLHAWIDLDGAETEVWHRRSPEGATEFIEINRTRNGWLSRSRHWVTDGVLKATTRGNGTGIVRQTIPLLEGTALVTPSVADTGRDWAAGGRPARVLRQPLLVLGGAGQAAAARPAHLELTYRGREASPTPVGDFSVDRVVRRIDGARSEWWLHEALDVPVRGASSAGEVVLVQLEGPDAVARR